MIGKVTLFILSIFIMVTLTAAFAVMTNRSITEGHIYDHITAFSERISMEGVMGSEDYAFLVNRMRDMGDYEVYIKYSRRLAAGIYEITTDKDKIIDRRLDKGDIMNLVIARQSRVVLNKAVYVMAAGEEYYTGYEVIRFINSNNVNISVRNINQLSPRVYDTNLNPYHGDDFDELPYNTGYISEYARYIKREEFDNGELLEVSFTEY